MRAFEGAPSLGLPAAGGTPALPPAARAAALRTGGGLLVRSLGGLPLATALLLLEVYLATRPMTTRRRPMSGGGWFLYETIPGNTPNWTSGPVEREHSPLFAPTPIFRVPGSLWPPPGPTVNPAGPSHNSVLWSAPANKLAVGYWQVAEHWARAPSRVGDPFVRDKPFVFVPQPWPITPDVIPALRPIAPDALPSRPGARPAPIIIPPIYDWPDDNPLVLPGGPFRYEQPPLRPPSAGFDVDTIVGVIVEGPPSQKEPEVQVQTQLKREHHNQTKTRLRERKVRVNRAVIRALKMLANAVTEFDDFMDALIEGFDPAIQKKIKKLHPVEQYKYVFEHFEDINFAEAVASVLNNQIEDIIYSFPGRYTKKAIGNNPYWTAEWGPGTGGNQIRKLHSDAGVRTDKFAPVTADHVRWVVERGRRFWQKVGGPDGTGLF